ncbi:YdiU family protein [Oceanobacillus sp. FSL K6-2867]|uniref:protein adenylyltransferase SelO n=1 Tax=Oceanobacillus sp. FSL K6-2867 TaxID=2954748 RepID=UPI0030DC9A02
MGKKSGNDAGWNLENSYMRLPDFLYKKTNPTPVQSPGLVIFNKKLGVSLGLHAEDLINETGVELLAGNRIPEGSIPIAQSYAGHQFGHFTMLGDGRAVLLGEQITPENERFDIQLKGAGRTPYSRGGDGRAALGPMLREYIISEAMHGLGIPTSRSLAVVTTGESIIRENELPGAILTRAADSHLRVGTFQYAANWGSTEDLRALADYTLERHFSDGDYGENRYLYLLQKVMERQAALVAKWQQAGFIHGVMNTDNMTISGETIDYGPCAFMDTYHQNTVFSSIDIDGRYAYGNQPHIAGWNLARFAESLLPLLHENEEQALELAQEAISAFSEMFRFHWMKGMRAKLGIFNEEKKDIALVETLLRMMQKHQADYTNTFLALTFNWQENFELGSSPEFKEWYQLWQERLARQEEAEASSRQLMRDSNPAVIPRNHQVEAALSAAVEDGDYHVMERLLHILSDPYAHTDEQSKFAAPPVKTSIPYRTYCGT